MDIQIISPEEAMKFIEEFLIKREKLGYRGKEKDMQVFRDALEERIDKMGFYASSYTPTEWNGKEWVIAGDPIIHLHNVPEEHIVYVLNHESLHIALNRMAEAVFKDMEGNVISGSIDELIDFFEKRLFYITFREVSGLTSDPTKTDIFLMKWVYDMLEEGNELGYFGENLILL